MALKPFLGGAKKVVFVEKNTNNVNLICSNVSLLGAEKETRVMKIMAEKAIGLLKNSQFDVIFIDPPYELAKPPYIKEIFQLILDHNVLSENGYLVLEYPAYDEAEIFEIDDLELVKSKNYGKSGLAIWVQKSVSK